MADLVRPPGTTPTRCESRPNLAGIRFLYHLFWWYRTCGYVICSYGVTRFQLNSISNDVFLAIDADNSAVNDSFGRENDVKHLVFHRNND